jgi:hypothetical protein
VSETGPEPLIRVLLLIENRLSRESLRRILRKRADFLVVGSHGNKDSSLGKVFKRNAMWWFWIFSMPDGSPQIYEVRLAIVLHLSFFRLP